MERYIKLLKANPEVADYKIVYIKKHSYQLFYVDDKLETNRVSDSDEYSITLYVNVGEMRGSSTFDAYDYQSDDEVAENISEAIFNAKLALNPYFDLPEPTNDKPIKLNSNLADRPFNVIAEEIADLIFEIAKDKKAYSAATEIFLNKVNKRFVNSKGIDLSEEKYSGEIEFIPTVDTPEKEVEVYHMTKFLEFNKDELAKEVNEILDLAEARFNAVPLDVKNDIDIILDTDEIGKTFMYFAEDLNYATKFQKSNLFEIDMDVQKDGTGDKLNLSLVPFAPNAYESRSFDADGIVLKNVELIKNGIAVDRAGTNQFAKYLKVPCNGMHPIIDVKPGNTSFKKMCKKPYIRCVAFSNMQMERVSGMFGGEVRLGFYFDGEKEVPVTGFTIMGVLHNLRGNMIYSKEEATYSDYHGPRYILIPGMKIV